MSGTDGRRKGRGHEGPRDARPAEIRPLVRARRTAVTGVSSIACPFRRSIFPQARTGHHRIQVDDYAVVARCTRFVWRIIGHPLQETRIRMRMDPVIAAIAGVRSRERSSRCWTSLRNVFSECVARWNSACSVVACAWRSVPFHQVNISQATQRRSQARSGCAC